MLSCSTRESTLGRGLLGALEFRTHDLATDVPSPVRCGNMATICFLAPFLNVWCLMFMLCPPSLSSPPHVCGMHKHMNCKDTKMMLGEWKIVLQQVCVTYQPLRSVLIVAFARLHHDVMNEE